MVLAMHPEQKRAYQAMSLERKLEVTLELNLTARKLKAAWLREIHPDWTGEQIQEKVREIFLHART